MLSFLPDFEGKELVSVAKGDLDLGKLEDEAEKKQHEETEAQYKELVEKMKTALADKAKDVRVTFRLTDSPACLVADENELSGNLMRMLKAAGQNAPESKPILEINPDHPLVQRLKYEEAKFGDWSHILFDQAMLAEGGALADPAAYVKTSTLARGLINRIEKKGGRRQPFRSTKPNGLRPDASGGARRSRAHPGRAIINA